MKDQVYERILKALEPHIKKFNKFKSRCPEEGEFHGYKFVVLDTNWRYLNQFNAGIVKLRIPADAKRISPYCSAGKCRCDKAFVEEIRKMNARIDRPMWDVTVYDSVPDMTFEQYSQTRVELLYEKTDNGEYVNSDKGYSMFSREKFIYRVNEMACSDDFDDDPWTECSHGIHFFMTPEEANEYGAKWLFQNW